MKPAEEIDTVYAEIGERKEISKNYYGDLIIRKRYGLYVYTDINANSDNKRFFRFTNRLVSQTYYYIIPCEICQPIIVYCWSKSSLDDIVNIKSTFNSNSEQVIKRHNLGFLPYYYSSKWQDDTTGPVRPSGWIVTTVAYSITENAFEYYNSVVKQLNAEERIFDPVPSQIKGNMHCLSDTTQIVLGLFEVASRTVRHTAFDWSTGRNSYDILNLPEYISPSYNGCQNVIMPDFWITFY
jgi:hypothetical protein